MSSIDVIVPCYNYARFLKECVDSVLAGGATDVRVLIIDDASSDNTAEVASGLAQADSRVNVIRHYSNRGHIATYNEGIAWATADYLLLLSADDYLLPGALRRAADVLEAHPEIGFVFGKAINSTESGIRKPAEAEEYPSASDTRFLSSREFFELIEARGTVNFVRTPTAVVRTSLQKQAGGYRPELPHAGDMEMWLRLAAYSPVGMLGTYQAVYRLHNNNMYHGYLEPNKGLPDLEQRKAALDFFYHACRTVLPDADQIYRRLQQPLGFQALRLAHAAFNEGDQPTAQQLSRFARTLVPQTRNSRIWMRLKFKQLIGTRCWRTIQNKKFQLTLWCQRLRRFFLRGARASSANS